MIDYSSLQKALQSLEKAIKRSKEHPEDEEVRDSVIQRFEYTYELSWKMLKRKLSEDTANSSEIDALSFKDLFREGAQKGWVTNPEHWFDYRTHRNLTVHTYDHIKAQQVYHAALLFFDDAQELYLKLTEGTQS